VEHFVLTNHTYSELLADFNTFVIVKGYGNGKPVPYQHNLKEFLFFISSKNKQTIKEVIASDIINYYEYLKRRSNMKRPGVLAEATIKGHLFTLRIFFDYLLETGELDKSPARLPKFQWGKYPDRTICCEAEIKLLFETCETHRDRAILNIAYGCGLRRSEMQNLNATDVLLHQGVIIVREGKGNKPRSIPLSDILINDLKKYLFNERSTYYDGQKNISAFFINSSGIRMSGHSLNERLKVIIKKTNDKDLIEKKITLHSLRHSIATHLLDHGATIEFIQFFLGHTLIDTAHLYSKQRKRQLQIKKAGIIGKNNRF
jgi:integrase/recombinase XerD